MDEFVAIKKKAPPTSIAPSVTKAKEKAKPEVKKEAKPKAEERAKSKVKEKAESKVEEKAEFKVEEKAESRAEATPAHKRKPGRSYCALSALRGKLIVGGRGLMFDEADTNVSLRIVRVDNILATAINDGMLLSTEALFYLDEKSLGAATLVGMDTGSYQHVGKYDAMRHISSPEEGQMRIAGRVLVLAEDHFKIRIGRDWIAGKNKSVPRIRVSSTPPSGWKKGQWIEETLIREGSKWRLKT